MNITKNTVSFTADEYKNIMLSFSDILTSYIDLIQRIIDEEKLRQNHRSYLGAREEIFESLYEKEQMIDEACELVSKHLNFSKESSSFEPGYDVSLEKSHSGNKKFTETDDITDCDYCDLYEDCMRNKMRDDSGCPSETQDALSKEETFKRILNIIEDAALEILDGLGYEGAPY